MQIVKIDSQRNVCRRCSPMLSHGGTNVPATKAELLNRDSSRLIHSLHNRTAQQSGHVWVRGEGAVLTDADGKEFLDGLAGLWNVVLGHGRKELAEAAATQMNELAYCTGYAGGSNTRAIELAERLSAI